MIVTILGCGHSQGVPSITKGWGACDPKNPKNYRRRASILVEKNDNTFLIDTTPDLKDQLVRAKVKEINAILYTHSHADHLHGIDEIRAINQLMQAPIPIYADEKTLFDIKDRFGYVFDHPKDGYFYRPCLESHIIKPHFTVNDIDIETFEMDHGHEKHSIGYKIGKFAYTTDVVNLDETIFDILRGVEVWVVDCLQLKPHMTHSHLDQTLEWIDEVKPELAVLTHMGPELDYDTLFNSLPDGVLPAFDGMVMQVNN